MSYYGGVGTSVSALILILAASAFGAPAALGAGPGEACKPVVTSASDVIPALHEQVDWIATHSYDRSSCDKRLFKDFSAARCLNQAGKARELRRNIRSLETQVREILPVKGDEEKKVLEALQAELRGLDSEVQEVDASQRELPGSLKTIEDYYSSCLGRGSFIGPRTQIQSVMRRAHLQLALDHELLLFKRLPPGTPGLKERWDSLRRKWRDRVLGDEWMTGVDSWTGLRASEQGRLTAAVKALGELPPNDADADLSHPLGVGAGALLKAAMLLSTETAFGKSQVHAAAESEYERTRGEAPSDRKGRRDLRDLYEGMLQSTHDAYESRYPELANDEVKWKARATLSLAGVDLEAMSKRANRAAMDAITAENAKHLSPEQMGQLAASALLNTFNDEITAGIQSRPFAQRSLKKFEELYLAAFEKKQKQIDERVQADTNYAERLFKDPEMLLTAIGTLDPEAGAHWIDIMGARLCHDVPAGVKNDKLLEGSSLVSMPVMLMVGTRAGAVLGITPVGAAVVYGIPALMQFDKALGQYLQTRDREAVGLAKPSDSKMAVSNVRTVAVQSAVGAVGMFSSVKALGLIQKADKLSQSPKLQSALQALEVSRKARFYLNLDAAEQAYWLANGLVNLDPLASGKDLTPQLFQLGMLSLGMHGNLGLRRELKRIQGR